MKMVSHSRKDKEEVKIATDGIPSTKSLNMTIEMFSFHSLIIRTIT